MTTCGTHLIMTNDLNRFYRDTVHKRGTTWTMEDWLRCLDCFSVYIFHGEEGVLMPVVTPAIQGTHSPFDLRVMWGQLCSAMLDYF